MMKAPIFIKDESIDIIEAKRDIPEATRDLKGLHRVIIEARFQTRGLHDEVRVKLRYDLAVTNPSCISSLYFARKTPS